MVTSNYHQGSDLNPTLNVSGQPGPSPREYTQHRRYSPVSRLRYSQQELAFLSETAIRLLGSATTANIDEIYAKLTKYGAQRVTAATNISQLP